MKSVGLSGMGIGFQRSWFGLHFVCVKDPVMLPERKGARERASVRARTRGRGARGGGRVKRGARVRKSALASVFASQLHSKRQGYPWHGAVLHTPLSQTQKHYAVSRAWKRGGLATFERLEFVMVSGRMQAVEPAALVGCARGREGCAAELLRVKIERAALRVVLPCWQRTQNCLGGMLVPESPGGHARRRVRAHFNAVCPRVSWAGPLSCGRASDAKRARLKVA